MGVATQHAQDDVTGKHALRTPTPSPCPSCQTEKFVTVETLTGIVHRMLLAKNRRAILIHITPWTENFTAVVLSRHGALEETARSTFNLQEIFSAYLLSVLQLGHGASSY